MNDTLISFQGNVGGDVTLRHAAESPVASFRVACTPRHYQKRSEEWVDGETQWYTVNVWRALAEHCAASLRRGDPVFVQGRLRARSWVNSAGTEVTGHEVEATVVGHDLTRGTAVFSRSSRSRSEPAAPDDAAPSVGPAPQGVPAGEPAPAPSAA